MIENCDLILTGLGAVDAHVPQTLWDSYVSDDLKQEILKKVALVSYVPTSLMGMVMFWIWRSMKILLGLKLKPLASKNDCGCRW